MSVTNPTIHEAFASRKATREHMNLVATYLESTLADLEVRSLIHDASKLKEPELSIFDAQTSKLAKFDYASDEYQAALQALKPALDHHYQKNDHHPEHFENGINDMNLVNLIEMCCDWYAAMQRHDSADIARSLDINQGRFEISNQLMDIIRNTFTYMGWDQPE